MRHMNVLQTSNIEKSKARTVGNLKTNYFILFCGFI